MNINEEIQTAFEHYQSGNLQLAKSICKKIITEQSDNSEVIIFLGIIYTETKQYNSAIKHFKKVIKLNPNNAYAYFHLGNALRGQGQPSDEVIAAYEKALEINPDFAEANNNLGNILTGKGQLNEAIIYYQKATEINPDFADAYYNLANALRDKEELENAKTYYQEAIEIDPDFADAYYNLGHIFSREKNHDEAIYCYQKTAELIPDSPEVYNSLGNAFQEKGLYDESIDCYSKALQLDPSFAEAYYNLGGTYYRQGSYDEATAAYDKAIKCAPSFIKAHWAKCFSLLHIIYPDEESIHVARKKYHDELVRLSNTIPLITPEDIQNAVEAIGTLQPFILACHGLNDRDLQQLYGNLVSRIMSLKYPEWTNQLSMPAYSATDPIRVGIVSKFFYYHSNWKIPIKGWVENIDKNKFELFGYYTGKTNDDVTGIAKSCFNHFKKDINSFENLCKTIKEDNLHVLLYPEIGMDPMTLRLASLRLAPIQCASWGHPDTSGLPTIDYYLSSELMEPSDGDLYYTERLIRLPNLSICYTPLDFPDLEINRETFDLPPNSVIYFCCHSLFTHLPQYDDIYPLIAQQVSNSKFVFISYTSKIITEQFRSKIHQAFDRFKMNAEDYIIFLPRLDPDHYHALNCLSDVFLDTPGWSGGNSTFEAVACNLPIVTLPGKLMRQRHCYAILTMMGMTETIAATSEEYVKLAVRLGKDSLYRQQISEKISANKYRIYYDKDSVTGLEEFLTSAVVKSHNAPD
jgi:protein O-GlcNAc transferase